MSAAGANLTNIIARQSARNSSRAPRNQHREENSRHDRERRPQYEDRAHRAAAVTVEHAEIIDRNNVIENRDRFADQKPRDQGEKYLQPAFHFGRAFKSDLILSRSAGDAGL